MLRKRLMAVVLSAVMTAAIFTGCASKDDSKEIRQQISQDRTAEV